MLVGEGATAKSALKRLGASERVGGPIEPPFDHPHMAVRERSSCGNCSVQTGRAR